MYPPQDTLQPMLPPWLFNDNLVPGTVDFVCSNLQLKVIHGLFFTWCSHVFSFILWGVVLTGKVTIYCPSLVALWMVVMAYSLTDVGQGVWDPTYVYNVLKQFNFRKYKQDNYNLTLLTFHFCKFHLNNIPTELYRKVLEVTLSPVGIETAKLYPILLSSGLPREMLGQIWALANRATPGKLTKEELYTVLAMVAMSQVL